MTRREFIGTAAALPLLAATPKSPATTEAMHSFANSKGVAFMRGEHASMFKRMLAGSQETTTALGVIDRSRRHWATNEWERWCSAKPEKPEVETLYLHEIAAELRP